MKSRWTRQPSYIATNVHTATLRRARASIACILSAVLLLLPPLTLAQEDDPLVIRGPQGSEQTDVRMGEEYYGPVTRADTLWNLANRYRPHSSVSLYQAMSAIVQANPQAFPGANPNEMEIGFFLRIPSLQEIQMVNPEAARRQIELGERLQQSETQLQRNRDQAEQSGEQRDQILLQTRQQAEQAVGEVREDYSSEFEDLRERMAAAIENTESAYADNQELRERVERIAEALDDIQNNMVNEEEFQQQLRTVLEQQEELRLQQDTNESVDEERGLANRVMSNPVALILLAFLPALLLIIIATLVLRRRESSTEKALQPVRAQHDHAPMEAPPETAPASTGQDDFELDESMDDFDDLDDDDGDDLSALEDEMLVPDEEEDTGVQLDDDDSDELDFDSFEALDEDVAPTDDGTDILADESETESQGTDAAVSGNETTATEEDDDSELSQSELDELLDGEADSGASKGTTETSADEDEVAEEPVEDASESTEDDSAEEPSPGELFSGEDDAAGETEGETDDDDFDFDAIMDEFDTDDDDDLEDDDIESLLAKSDELVSNVQDDESAQRPVDVKEADEIDAEESLDFSADESTENSEPESTPEAEVKEVDAQPEDEGENEYIDIDDILNEADDDDDAFDSEEDKPSESSQRADAEDNLAAQLDLARAYLEMDEVEEARETVQGVIEQAQGELLQEAKDLLDRIGS